MAATIGHVILSVSDFVRSVGFYDRLLLPLGFESRWTEQGEDVAIKQYHSQGHTLFIRCDSKREHQPFVRDVGLDHLAIKVSGRDEVDKAFETVSQVAGTRAQPPKAYLAYSETYYAFYFRDPDGIPLQVAATEQPAKPGAAARWAGVIS